MAFIINTLTTILLILWGAIVTMSPMIVGTRGLKERKSKILAVILFLGYPAIVFAILKSLNFYFFGMDVRWWLLSTLIISVGIIFYYGLPRMLINLMRGIPNSGYFINESAVYFYGNKLKQADPRSFDIINQNYGYAKDHQHVYYFDKIIEEADPPSFEPVEVIEKSSLEDPFLTYWKDERYVYFKGQKVNKADPKTFRHIRGQYGKDAKHVYYENRILEKADPNKFKFLNDNITSDDTHIFCINKRSEIPIDLESFEIVEKNDEVYCKDKYNVYIPFYHQKEPLVNVDGADPDTFMLLDRNYAKDKNHVYYYGYYKGNTKKLIKLEGANPVTFSVGYDADTKSEASDGTNHYMYGERI